MENMNIIIFNSILSLLSLWFILYTNRKFLYRTRINKQRFKLFALRDELTILAMKGQVDFNSKEYQFLLKSLNALIGITGDFRVTDFLKFIAATYDSPQQYKKINKIRANIQKDTDGLHPIWIRYCRVMNQIMSGHLRLLIMLMVSIAGVLLSIKLCTNIASMATDQGQRILSSSKEIQRIANSEI